MAQKTGSKSAVPTLRRSLHHIPVTAAERDRHKLQGLRPSLGRFVGEVSVDTQWLEIPLPGDWVIAYRVASSGTARRRRTVICEVRVFPDAERRDAGEWSARLLGDKARPTTRFSFGAVRSAFIERTFNAALQATRENAKKQGHLTTFKDPSPARDNDVERQGGARGTNASFYAEFAVRYHVIENKKHRMRGASTRAILGREYGKSIRTIAGWIQIAKDRGYLERTAKGQRGAQLTDVPARMLTARRLAELGHEQVSPPV